MHGKPLSPSSRSSRAWSTQAADRDDAPLEYVRIARCLQLRPGHRVGLISPLNHTWKMKTHDSTESWGLMRLPCVGLSMRWSPWCVRKFHRVHATAPWPPLLRPPKPSPIFGDLPPDDSS